MLDKDALEHIGFKVLDRKAEHSYILIDLMDLRIRTLLSKVVVIALAPTTRIRESVLSGTIFRYNHLFRRRHTDILSLP